MKSGSPELDIVVWGATGFVGRLVAEYLLERYGAGGSLSWALGGRDRAKLEELQQDLGADAAPLGFMVGDADDEASLVALARSTRVVCTTVGPYAKVGSKLVAACVREGTDYCDLTGEVQWMRRMIDAHQTDAAASGARIVHCCGFDSIPSDLGVFHLQREMKSRHGLASPRIRTRVARARGGFSGGTVASLLNVLDEARRSQAVRRILADPYALNPEGKRRGPTRSDRASSHWDPAFDQWCGPFVMASINTRVVRRSNALLGDAYGTDFLYDEAVLTGSGMSGRIKATALSAGLNGFMAAGSLGPLRALLAAGLPKPGEGPSREKIESGFFELRLHAEHPEDQAGYLRSRVTGDRDPGYGSTAKMLGETAVCLAKEEPEAGGGFWTPASLMGDKLLARLPKHAGVEFAVAD